MTTDVEALATKLEEEGKAILSSFAGDEDMYDYLFKSADALRSQAERIKALEAKCAGLERDAGRYRWLRQDNGYGDDVPFICIMRCGVMSRWTVEYADTKIDAAIAAQAGSKEAEK